jgi:hypothetical protein
MKNRKPETENGKPEIGPDRFSFPVSCFRFPVSGFFPVWFRLVRVSSYPACALGAARLQPDRAPDRNNHRNTIKVTHYPASLR